MIGKYLDKDFWEKIKEDKFSLPAGHSAPSLTEELFSYLGSTDPELRDGVAYEIFANWLEQGLYTQDYLRASILRLIVNLQEGLGESDTDTVFLRSFSVLCLAEIIHHENEHPFLDKDEIHNILSKGLEYMQSEQDLRGYVRAKGWAHALAHTADLLYVLGENVQLGREELARILDAVRSILLRPTEWVYIYAEEDRLVRAVMAVFERKLFDDVDIQSWLLSFSDLDAPFWKGSFEDELTQRAYFNTKTFLRGLHQKITENEEFPGREALMIDILNAIKSLKQY